MAKDNEGEQQKQQWPGGPTDTPKGPNAQSGSGMKGDKLKKGGAPTHRDDQIGNKGG